MKREWCKACGGTVEVADEFDTDSGDRERTFRAYRVTQLECGHVISYDVDPRSVL